MVGVVSGRHADATFRLHEHVLIGWRAIFALDDDVRLGKALFHVPVAHLDVLQQVAALPFFVDQWDIRLAGLFRAAHHWERFVCHLNQLERLSGDF